MAQVSLKTVEVEQMQVIAKEIDVSIEMLRQGTGTETGTVEVPQVLFAVKVVDVPGVAELEGTSLGKLCSRTRSCA